MMAAAGLFGRGSEYKTVRVERLKIGYLVTTERVGDHNGDTYAFDTARQALDFVLSLVEPQDGQSEG